MLGKKLFAFICLLIIQLFVSIVYKYSQTKGKYEYSPLAIITCAEAIKFLISSSLYSLNYLKIKNENENNFLKLIQNELSKKFLLNTFGLAFLYCLNNQIAFILFLRVDPASIILFRSLSSLESAILLWAFANRHINQIQWGSICLQVIGLIIVQYDACKSTTLFEGKYYFLLTITSLITAICSVLNEHLVKTYNINLNLQNTILYIFGFILNLFIFIFFSNIINENQEKKRFFQGYSWIVVSIILSNSLLGISITFVYKYADAIVKTFSTACAAGVLLIFNITLFHLHTNAISFLGATVIFIASYIYFVATSSSSPITTSTTTTNQSTLLSIESQDNSNNIKYNSKILIKDLVYFMFIFIPIISFIYIFVKNTKYTL
ncbi:unnamed protein product [Adineta steineri]|uniref:Uncharacterized protein n=1 Tax=Adineta steineri TaxID=433720 RepID=A0A815JU23_9BILA|nr:unnamed protein product [Adineta steineri]CAF1609539.1 unnamed protein product [Adineta steineri]